MVLLGLNVDHVATVRNARGGLEPDPVELALIAEDFGADGITVHLREDRRHIRDNDLRRMRKELKTRLNLEMAATDDMLSIALEVGPDMVTLVPEKRQELTTEGGLDVLGQAERLKSFVRVLSDSGIYVSMFVDPNLAQLQACQAIHAPMVELHTGDYAEAFREGPEASDKALNQLIHAAMACHQLGLKVNAGHGLNYDNVQGVLKLPNLVELNIGHSIISRALRDGLASAVTEMKTLITTP
jgi:pyridoxine 5-phosphate synthase